MPFLIGLFVVAYIDRVSVSYANLEMSKDLGFNLQVFGCGAGIFFHRLIWDEGTHRLKHEGSPGWSGPDESVVTVVGK